MFERIIQYLFLAQHAENFTQEEPLSLKRILMYQKYKLGKIHLNLVPNVYHPILYLKNTHICCSINKIRIISYTPENRLIIHYNFSILYQLLF